MVGVGGSGKELTQNLLGTGNGVGKGFHQLSGCLARYINHRMAMQQWWLAGGRPGEKATGYPSPRFLMFEDLAFWFISWD